MPLALNVNWSHLALVLASAGCAGAVAWAHYDTTHGFLPAVVLAVCGSLVTGLGLASPSVLASSNPPAAPVVAPVAPPKAP